MDTNPLKQYFRQPAIYLRLPSQGRFWPKGTLDLPANGEIPVLPMTTMDEITYRTPDALFNGAAVISVIQSCVPNIRDAWHMPAMDMDTVLVAIRIATYGHEMDINARCPECGTEGDYGVDLRTVMENIKAPDYTQSMALGDLEIWFHPMNYQQVNDSNMAQFEDQKTLQAMIAPEVSDQQRAEHLGEILKKITAVTTRALSQNIAMVKTPQAQVTDPQHIEEWLNNCDRGTFNAIKDHIVAVKQAGEIPPLRVKCTSCGHDYDQQFTMDMTTFFADAS